MRRLPLLALLVIGLLGVALLVARRAHRATDAPPRAELRVADLLGGAAGADDGFLRAEGPRPFAFPADHLAHDGFRTEWWYLTGQLTDGEGRRFGYQLTFFRQALAPAVPRSASAWRTGHVWMAHFAVTDVARDRFRWSERFAREALGLAGASGPPLEVRLEDWRFAATGARADAFELAARDGEIALDLRLEPTRPPVLQGEGGYSRKGPEPGAASYYYSMPRMASRGTLEIAGERLAVEGLSWLDREWSTSVLGPGLQGWDWVALHLDDGRDLMLYRLRRADGSASPESSGTLVAADGGVTRLAPGSFRMEPRGAWRSPRGGSYPAAWKVEIPAQSLELDLRPLVADQELDASVRYWEGIVEARGRATTGPLRGSGYLEMTGYEAPPEGSRSRDSGAPDQPGNSRSGRSTPR